jgi:alkylation response protein AidB-like acyl-CoA dehydrogenase
MRAQGYLTERQIHSPAMDLTPTPEQEAFRAEARAWLTSNVPREPLPSFDTPEGFDAHRAWERTLHASGWAVVSWPAEYGGRGASLHDWLIFEEEYWRAGAPGRVGQNGLFLLGPTMMEHGTPAQKERFLARIAGADDIWCQGWSEPDTGSDLASVSARAERRGDAWVLNGQKTWCSRGAFADWMFGLFRSEPGSERHRGLTMILVPLDARGVTVRPIAQLDGETGFAEVFLDDVEVPVEANALGGIGEGWKVAMSTAGFERGLLLRSPGRFGAAAARLIDLWKRVGHLAPASLRDDVTRAWIDAEAYRLATDWAVTRVEDGATIGAESSLTKLFWSEMDVRLHRTALEVLGTAGELARGAPHAIDDGRWLDGFLFALAGPIYAGTNEIQRSIVAERLLGLPR